MKKRLESEQGDRSQDDNTFMNLLPSNIYLKVGVELAFYIINIVVAITYRSEYITFKSYSQDNIVLNYFREKDLISVRIPFYLVIIALNVTINRIENVFSLTYNLIK
jgi:hypothetical protein